MTERETAETIDLVLKDSRWIGVHLARAYLEVCRGTNPEAVARQLYKSGSITLTKAKQILPKFKSSGFRQFIPKREKLGSAENPVTKLFPAAITEQRFLAECDSLQQNRSSVDCMDELENLRGHDREKYGMVMSILNSGFQAGGKVPRSERVKDGQFEVVFFDVFCPKVLAGINRLVDTLEDRCFQIPMVRKTKNEIVKRFNLKKQNKDLEALREDLKLWAESRRDNIEAIYGKLDEIEEMAPLDNRFQDISEPLVAIASYADTEMANGGTRILPELMSVLLGIASNREKGENREGHCLDVL